ncbi:MAG: deoxyribodipyrimidine photo-lyase [Bacteroidota bacterium]
MPAPTLVWFRHDLRLADHPALYRAVERGGPVVPVFIWAPEEDGEWAPGGAHRWWLHCSLTKLSQRLSRNASCLVRRSGPSLDALRDLIAATGADAVYWNARYEPVLHERDDEIAEALRGDGITVKTFASRILHDPTAVRTTTDGPYHVYTPFRNKFEETVEVGDPLDVPRMGEHIAPESWPESEDLESFRLLPQDEDGVNWAKEMGAFWTPGERAAHAALHRFLNEALIDYAESRNRPDQNGTSRFSPYLHHGELSPRQVWHRVNNWVRNGSMREAANAFLSEIIWREFSYHILYHYPTLPAEPLKDKFDGFDWRMDEDALRRWQRGQTGYPIVDAGMRQLWSIGWMHNRVRMIAGSFLTKDLMIPWQEGERWFWDTLVDADLASNAMNWQWVAGSGPDAQPFFRVFNPVSQGEKHDPDGAYVRRWVPELKDLPTKYLHSPWTAPAEILAEAGVVLGETYPEPIVDHSEARDRALEASAEIK